MVLAALHSISAVPAPGSVVLAPAYDGNGNILAWLDCASGQIVARQEYDPFGKVIPQEQAPSVVRRLSFEFSAKYTDAETGWCYYGFRYYSPDTPAQTMMCHATPPRALWGSTAFGIATLASLRAAPMGARAVKRASYRTKFTPPLFFAPSVNDSCKFADLGK